MSTSDEHVFKTKNGQAISISPQALKDSGFEIGDSVEVQTTKHRITFVKKDTSLKTKIHTFYQNGGVYQESIIDFGEAAGKEAL